MSTWFELDVDMPDSPKVLALAARLREPLAGFYVVRLYAYCYRQGTDVLDGPDSVEEVARWRGKRGVLASALLGVRVLDEQGEALVVHGVRERLEPHLAKKLRDAERARQRRANVAATSERRPRDYKDRDKDKDRDLSVPSTVSDPHPSSCLPPPPGGSGLERLVGLRKKLAQALDLPDVGVGRDPERVLSAFGPWLEVMGEDRTVEECLRLARLKHEAPGHLTWWAGWLSTVPLSDLRAWAAQVAANPVETAPSAA